MQKRLSTLSENRFKNFETISEASKVLQDAEGRAKDGNYYSLMQSVSVG